MVDLRGVEQLVVLELEAEALAALGVLREQTFGREKLFVHPKLMSLLTRDSNEFAAYSPR